jgi:hypothetical protein
MVRSVEDMANTGNLHRPSQSHHHPQTRQPQTQHRQPQARRRHPVAIALIGTLGAVLALYLAGRGVAEFFIVHYNDPASYRNDWGGPSLAGVFAVHTGPAVAIVAGTVIYLRRRLTRR